MFCSLSPTLVTRSGEIQSVVDNSHVGTRGSSRLVSSTAHRAELPWPWRSSLLRVPPQHCQSCSKYTLPAASSKARVSHCQDFCLVSQARSLLLGNLALFHKVHAQKHSASHSTTVHLPRLLFCQIRKAFPRVCFRLIRYKLHGQSSREQKENPWALLVQMQYSARLWAQICARDT